MRKQSFWMICRDFCMFQWPTRRRCLVYTHSVVGGPDVLPLVSPFPCFRIMNGWRWAASMNAYISPPYYVMILYSLPHGQCAARSLECNRGMAQQPKNQRSWRGCLCLVKSLSRIQCRIQCRRNIDEDHETACILGLTLHLQTLPADEAIHMIHLSISV